jgi:hypothetical protein
MSNKAVLVEDRLAKGKWLTAAQLQYRALEYGVLNPA